MNQPSPSKQLNFWSLVAFVFPFGLAPKAPGTFGSLAGIALIAILNFLGGKYLGFGVPGHISMAMGWWLVLILMTGFAWIAIHKTEAHTHLHDDQRIVIDEVAGQMWAFCLVPPTGWNLFIGFLLFRLLDITKPGPIGWVDRKLPGAAGTLLDDVLAGWIAALMLWAIYFII